jgi:hypothetical protein
MRKVLMSRVTIFAVIVFAAACKRDGGTSSSSTTETDANVRTALAAEGCKVTRTEGRVIWTSCGDAGEEGSLNLANLDETVKGMPAATERAAAARTFVHNLVQMAANMPETAPLGDLRLSIKTKDTIEATYRRVPPEAREKYKPVSWPLAGDLVAMAVVDRPDTIAMVMQPTIEKWKMTESAVYAKAIENLDAHPLAPKRFDRDGATLYALDDDQDAYESSRILSAQARASLEKALGGKALFAIPDREHLVAARKDDAVSVAKLRALAATMASGPYGISPAVFDVDEARKLRVVP